MKKVFCIFSVILFLFMLAACAPQNAGKSADQEISSEEAMVPDPDNAEDELPAACDHDFDEKGTCKKCGIRYVEEMSNEEKQAVISWMYDRANQYAKKGQLTDAEELDCVIWEETAEEYPKLDSVEIDDIFFSELNPRRAKLGSSKKDGWYEDVNSNKQPVIGDPNDAHPNETMLSLFERVLDNEFAGLTYEKNYDSKENVYYFNVYVDGCSQLTSTQAFTNSCDGMDGISSNGHTILGIKFIARILDGNVVVYESINGTGELVNEPVSSGQAVTGSTMGEKNALKSAKSYLNAMAFSYTGLIDQLKFDGYTDSEAKYAADYCGADWNEQATKSAKSYLDAMPFSKQGLIEQLEFDGFTHDQAIYGVSQNWD